MDINTITPIQSDAGIGNLQRIQPTSNSNRRRQQNPKRQKRNLNAKYTNEVTYKPDGHVESDEHGVRVDISV